MELNVIVDSYMKHGQSFKQRRFRLQGALNTLIKTGFFYSWICMT